MRNLLLSNNFYNQSVFSERLRDVTEHGMYSVVETMRSLSIQLAEGHLRLMVTMLDRLHLLGPSKTMATSTTMRYAGTSIRLCAKCSEWN